MATAANLIPANDTTGNLQALLNLYSGAKGSSSSSTVTSNLSQDNVSALIQSILGGTQGLASVAGGQKTAGLYNSSTNQQLLNDLLSRVTTQTAAQTAGTTTTQKKAGVLGGSELLGLLGTYAGGKVLGPSLKKLGSPLDDLGTKLADYFGGGSSASTGAGAGAVDAASFDGVSSLGGGAFSSGLGAMGAEAGAGIDAASFTGGLAAEGAAAGAGAAGAAGAAETAGAIGSTVEGVGLAEGAAGTAAAVTGAEAAGTAATVAEGAGLWESILAAASWVGSLFSDERLKMDIKEVGETKEGQAIYTYKYINDPITTHMGVMAQETRPQAVVRDPSGYLRVNYDKLLGID